MFPFQRKNDEHSYKENVRYINNELYLLNPKFERFEFVATKKEVKDMTIPFQIKLNKMIDIFYCAPIGMDCYSRTQIWSQVITQWR